MLNTESAMRRALVSGTLAGMASAAATALAGKKEIGSYAAPLNATSHILWGDVAAMQNRLSLKYTLTGFLLNHAAAIFWAAVYETFFGARPGKPDSPLRPLAGSALVTAGAYLTDYYLVPRRFTPGFEKRLSGRSLATVFGVLALGLAAHDLIARSTSPSRSW
ncbi:MAG: hypothetical protein A3I66_24040 [Burkholderiales bacterium RIFCSPLOWO2_02_FULL_57_36]|nr:MAG: hypothetical protein A3I66_24040 [Burkholderiales bacterium RIFCSPLOWO2_02_FULL_57_36]